MMKLSRRSFLITAIVFLVGAGCWMYYRSLFPYGKTHRCSRVLASALFGYAAENDGRFPSSYTSGAIGLSSLVNEGMLTLDMTVGKAGDLRVAEAFYQQNGYLTADHSSWHYVEGLATSDKDRAIAWDKIPLGHNGEVRPENSREVIMTNGLVEVVNEDEWEEFLTQQKRLADQTSSADAVKSK